MPKKMPISPGAYNSRLNEFYAEIMQRHARGNTSAQIFRWLTQEKQVKITYQNVNKFIKRNADIRGKADGLSVIRQILQLTPEKRRELFEILGKLLPEEKVPEFRSGKKAPEIRHPAAHPVRTAVQGQEDGLYDFLKIKPGDSPAQIRLKKIAALSTTDLDHIPEELLKPLEEDKK